MNLRARVKTQENMPDGVPCCTKMLQRLIAFKGEIVVSTASKLKPSKCQDCGARFMGMRVQNLAGWRIDPRAWEIEEGTP